MSSAGKGKGKGGRGKSKTGKVVSRSAKAGLAFPVGRVGRFLKKGQYAQRIGASAPIYLAAVLEYLCAEILELAGNAAASGRRTRINPRHIQIAIKQDEELSKLFDKITIAGGGVVVPSKDNEKKKEKSGKKAAKAENTQSQASQTY